MSWNYEKNDPILTKLYKVDRLHDSAIASIMRVSRETVKNHRIRLGFTKCRPKPKGGDTSKWDKPSKYDKKKEAKIMGGVDYSK